MGALIEICAEPTAFRSVSTPPTSIRQQAAWQSIPGLLNEENVDLKSRAYTRQFEFGGALAAGSNSGGASNAPIFIRRARILSMTAGSSILRSDVSARACPVSGGPAQAKRMLWLQRTFWASPWLRHRTSRKSTHRCLGGPTWAAPPGRPHLGGPT